MEENINARLLEGLQSAFESGFFTDLVITCGSEQYKVHRVVVCPQVKFFDNALKFPGKENQEGRIELPDDEPSIIKLVLQYIYEGDYLPKLSTRSKQVQATAYAAAHAGLPTPKTTPHTCQAPYSRRNFTDKCTHPYVCVHHTCGTNCEKNCHDFTCSKCILIAMTFEHKQYANGPEDLLVHAKLYTVAEKYGVAGLKDLARLKFAMTCDLFWDSPDFAIAARYVHTSTVDTDKNLRDIVHDIICDHVIIVKKDDIANLIEDFGLLNSIFLKKMEANGWNQFTDYEAISWRLATG